MGRRCQDPTRFGGRRCGGQTRRQAERRRKGGHLPGDVVGRQHAAVGESVLDHLLNTRVWLYTERRLHTRLGRMLGRMRGRVAPGLAGASYFLLVLLRKVGNLDGAGLGIVGLGATRTAPGVGRRRMLVRISGVAAGGAGRRGRTGGLKRPELVRMQVASRSDCDILVGMGNGSGWNTGCAQRIRRRLRVRVEGCVIG